MMTNDASGGGAESTMVTGKMAGNAAHEGALDAPFRVGGCGDCK
jgi:hypothetical protein